MSPRHRLGVALLLDPPGSIEVDGLRRALGDTALGAVPPHVTLVPPVNVRADDLGVVLRVLRHAASSQSGPIAAQLGPVSTFMPASPVVYLAVGGPDLDRLGRLRQAVVAGPMLRPDRWPWVPHVTLCDDAPAERTEAALAALSSYSTTALFDRVVLLEEREHRWQPLADACLGRPAVVGRGGLELEIVEGRLLGPDVIAMAGGSAEGALFSALDNAPAVSSIVLTGRRLGEVVGVAMGWQDGEVGRRVEVCVLVEEGSRRQGVGRALLQALQSSTARHGWATEGARGYGPEGFFEGASSWIREIHPAVVL
jgi:2'-5' RNA ligase